MRKPTSPETLKDHSSYSLRRLDFTGAHDVEPWIYVRACAGFYRRNNGGGLYLSLNAVIRLHPHQLTLLAYYFFLALDAYIYTTPFYTIHRPLLHVFVIGFSSPLLTALAGKCATSFGTTFFALPRPFPSCIVLHSYGSFVEHWTYERVIFIYYNFISGTINLYSVLLA